MKPVLTVFIDGLKPESIEYMPFLNTFDTKRRLRTELGYSITCHTSMYTGVYPNKHLRWFIWKYSPETSPFRWIKKYKIDSLSKNNKYIKYMCYKITRFLNRDNTAYFGVPFLWDVSMDHWHHFDVIEKKFWSEPNFLEIYPTIFEILNANNIQYEIVGMVHGRMDESSKIIEHHTFNEIKPWTYLFVGDVDPLSHRYGQDSIQMQERLKKIDIILEKKYGLFEKQFDDFYFMLFSDHGHIKVKDEINIHSFFKSRGKTLNNYIHFIDANYARFWFRDESEKKEVSKILLELDDRGFVLADEHFKKYNIDMPDNRYGDLIFYLDAPYIFDHGKLVVMGKQRNTSSVSMHGYLPDHSGSDGIFISNKEVINETHIKLEDITPTILDSFGVKKSDYMDGTILWKK